MADSARRQYQRSGHRYASDLTDARLPSQRKGGAVRTLTIIHALRRKPQALAGSIYRDELFPSTTYAETWRRLSLALQCFRSPTPTGDDVESSATIATNGRSTMPLLYFLVRGHTCLQEVPQFVIRQASHLIEKYAATSCVEACAG